MPGSPKAIIGKKNWMELEKLGVVKKIGPGEPTTWSSALHLAPKDGNDLRVCGDFRGLNDRTILDHYPLPSIRSFAGKLKGMTVFSKVDLRKAFYLVPLDEQSQLKTITLTNWGTYKYLRMPMGLRNSAQTFQKIIES